MNRGQSEFTDRLGNDKKGSLEGDLDSLGKDGVESSQFIMSKTSMTKRNHTMDADGEQTRTEVRSKEFNQTETDSIKEQITIAEMAHTMEESKSPRKNKMRDQCKSMIDDG